MRPFNVNLHLGGEWSEDGKYVGGFMKRIGPLNPDTVSYWEFIDIIKKHGFSGRIDGIWYIPPGKEIIDKQNVYRDDEILELCQDAQVLGVIDVYVVHDIDTAVLAISESSGEECEDFLNSGDETDVDYEVGEESESEGCSDSGEDDVSDSDDNEPIDNRLESTDTDITDYSDDNDGSKPFELGQEFANLRSFKDAVLAYSLREHRNLKFNKSSATKVSAVCKFDGCPWRIYASVEPRTNKFRVKSFNNEHICAGDGMNSLVGGQRLSNMFIDAIRANPQLKAKDMRGLVLADHNVRVSLPKCRRARQVCLDIINREQAEQFGRLWDYVGELKRSNPGSCIELEAAGNIFSRMYICFYALMDGWRRGCRRVIHLDGAFLKWHVEGELLAAIGRDANDQMFPIAWAIVEVENKDNWEWFIRHLVDDLRLGIGEGLTLVSDQQKGLLFAISQLLPAAEHRMCARHIYANWKKKNKGQELKKLFWKAAKSFSRIGFDRCMEKLAEASYEAYSDLLKYDACHWSRAFFSTHAKCDAVDNNLSESFNAVIKEARTKPIVQMLETIRTWVMTSSAGKIEEIRTWNGRITPTAKVILEAQKRLTSQCIPIKNGRGVYEIEHHQDRFVVHLRGAVSCTCRRFEVSGIPCCHIVCAIWDDSKGTENPEQLVSDYWSTDFWNNSYHNVLQPINGMNLWKETTSQFVIPPPYKTNPGRPKKKNRVRDPHESPNRKGKLSRHGRLMSCHRCHQVGHNTRTCIMPADNAPPAEKRPRGRPKKVQIGDAGPSQPRGQKRNASDGGTSSQQSTQPSQPPPPEFSQQPDQPPRYREGYGVYHSPVTGDTYWITGRRVMDTRDNTIFPSTLLRERERQKLNITKGKGKGKMP